LDLLNASPVDMTGLCCLNADNTYMNKQAAVTASDWVATLNNPSTSLMISDQLNDSRMIDMYLGSSRCRSGISNNKLFQSVYIQISKCYWLSWLTFQEWEIVGLKFSLFHTSCGCE